MDWYTGYGNVALSELRYCPAADPLSSAGDGRGRGRENSLDDCNSRAVGECNDLDIAVHYQQADARRENGQQCREVVMFDGGIEAAI